MDIVKFKHVSYLFKNKFGFTIIELLVVIAIIGVLAATVIGSLSSARDDGIAAKIKSELVTLGKLASIEESSTFSFDRVCGSNGETQAEKITFIVTAIENFSPESVVCNSDSDRYAVSAAIASSTYWCIDSEGYSDMVSDPLSTSPVDYDCP